MGSDIDRGVKAFAVVALLVGVVLFGISAHNISSSRDHDITVLNRAYNEEYSYYLEGQKISPIVPEEITSVRKTYTFYVDDAAKKVILSYRDNRRYPTYVPITH